MNSICNLKVKKKNQSKWKFPEILDVDLLLSEKKREKDQIDRKDRKDQSSSRCI